MCSLNQIMNRCIIYIFIIISALIYSKISHISCIPSVSVMTARVCVCRATDPKIINSANTFMPSESRGEVVLVFTLLHIICFA